VLWAPDYLVSAGGERRGLQHRFPVRMHKVRQYYFRVGAHQIIWRGPYIEGPEGTPLLAGGKAIALRRCRRTPRRSGRAALH
jgi:hypothetical protein